MNLGFLLSLVRGSNVYETIGKMLEIIAGFLAGLDANDTGKDDLLAGVFLSLADGIKAYGEQDNNEHGNIVDGLIAGLQTYRAEMVRLGYIGVLNHATPKD